LASLRRNDAEGWRRLLCLYGPLLRFWCARGGVPAGDIEDVVQEVLAAVTTSLATFRRDRPEDTFCGWLRGVTRNQMLMYFRRNRSQPRGQGGSDAWQNLQAIADPLPEPAEEEASEMKQLYLRALDQVRGEFKQRTWQAFWLAVIEGQTPDALAKELKTTPANIRQAKSRVLRRLKEELGDVLS
jgi:RNA polymerase sigma-70 factor (ECF subfamily)